MMVDQREPVHELRAWADTRQAINRYRRAARKFHEAGMELMLAGEFAKAGAAFRASDRAATSALALRLGELAG